MSKKIVAIVASYRKSGTIDTAVEVILAGAREKGAETQTIYLADQHLEFCTNCRQCVQTPGIERGKCVIDDDLESILAKIEAADAVVMASSVNYYDVTALFRRYLERLLGYAYWPWGGMMPRVRRKQPTRKAVLVASAGMPGLLIPYFTGAAKSLRMAAAMVGAKPVAHLWIGQAAEQPHPALSPRTLRQARSIGIKLA